MYVSIDDVATPSKGDLVYLCMPSEKTLRLVARKVPDKASKEQPFLSQSLNLEGVPAILALAFVKEVNDKSREVHVEMLNTWNKNHVKKLEEAGWDISGNLVWRKGK